MLYRDINRVYFTISTATVYFSTAPLKAEVHWAYIGRKLVPIGYWRRFDAAMKAQLLKQLRR